MSGRYIDADAVEKIINDIRDCISVDGYWAILQRLEKVTTADVVEVVRCKDCKYHGATIEEQPTPSIMCAHMHDNDYCSYGERREDGIQLYEGRGHADEHEQQSQKT